MMRKKSKAWKGSAKWREYKQLQMRADKAWAKFQTDMRKNAKPSILIKDFNNLLLVLGECNYMAREYARLAA